MAASSEPRSLPDVAEPAVEREPRKDGSFVLRSTTALGPHDATIGTWLARWAEVRPEGTFLAQRAGGEWRKLTYADAWREARAVGQALVDRDLSVDRPVAILSGNSIDHAVVALGAMLVGVPAVPVSVPYSTMSRSFELLRHVAKIVTPGLVFVDQWAPYRSAIEALPGAPEVVVGDGDAPEGRASALATLTATEWDDGGEAAAARVTGDTVAKILMTSGSTGQPKGVLTTHGMLTANQQALLQVWPFVEADPPTIVDWLPWSHTFGGSHNFNLILRTGGTLYIDEGRPAPGRFDETIRTLREVSPTIQFNVPAGFAMLAAALENDEALRASFFARLKVLFYAAAALPQDVWRRLDELAERTLGRRVWLTTAWGATETAPLATAAHFAADVAGNIGVPVPGVSLKLVPADDKLELRVKGPNVTPGYHRDAERTAAAFDEEGFYRIGDAGLLADPERPEAGIIFDGRIAEDFKLSTGTWVNVGWIRTEVMSAAAGLLQHAVVVGRDQDWVGLLGWLNVDEARRVSGTGKDPFDLARDSKVHGTLLGRLTTYNQRAQGSSRRVARVMLMADAPSLDAGEVTDKGYINAAAVRRHRDDDIEMLYDEGAASHVIVLA